MLMQHVHYEAVKQVLKSRMLRVHSQTKEKLLFRLAWVSWWVVMVARNLVSWTALDVITIMTATESCLNKLGGYGLWQLLPIMRALQLSSQSGGTCQCSFDHFGALYAVNVQMAPTTVATDPVYVMAFQN